MTASPSTTGFTGLQLAPAILQAVQTLGYETPTPIQAECIPHLLAGRDLLGQAQTGTGKTAAFALPLLSRLDVTSRQPQLLVLTPTRELALQVAEAFQSYAHFLKDFHVLPLYGGQGMQMQLRQLQRGAQVIVGTPGRVMDHLRRSSLSLARLQALVLDEADEMLKMGFIDDIEWIFEQAPEQRQVALFSATMPEPIRRVARKHLRDPMEIKVKVRTETVAAIEQRYCLVSRPHKMDVLTRVLEVEPFDGLLIFVRTKTATTEVADKLQAHGFAAEALNGDMNQAMRERAVGRLKDGRLDILVATDVAARGLDVERISHVVNYDIPNDPESYVHRIGRTGRAGRSGKALLFVQPRERNLLKLIERTTRQPIPAMELPSADDLSEHRIDRFTNLLRETLADQDLDYYYRLISRIERQQELSSTDIAAALTYLSQRERPFIVEELQQQRHTTEHRKKPQDHPNVGTKQESRRKGPQIPLQRYRIDVGSEHQVTPREIVGAIANEAGLEGRYIGAIEIHPEFSLIDLPEGMPKEVYRHLRKVRVCGRPLKIQLDSSSPAPPRRDRTHSPQTKGKRSHKTGRQKPAVQGEGRQRSDPAKR
ncbi:MAG: DEAD/DEAH box helicase [Chromatiales bacterium]|jgi:ATP-dependent RNA helicase DeaD